MGHDVDDGEENYEIHSQQDDNLDEHGLPSTCRICSGPFRSPIQTTCGHYFCESCALSHYSSSGNCFHCSKPTHGIFNDAPKLAQRSKPLIKAQNNESEAASDTGSSPKAGHAKRGESPPSSSSSEGGGVLTREDKLVMQEYKRQKGEGESKKYVSQNGWFIP